MSKLPPFDEDEFGIPRGQFGNWRLGPSTFALSAEQEEVVIKMLKRQERREKRNDLLYDGRSRAGFLVVGLLLGSLSTATYYEQFASEYRFWVAFSFGGIAMLFFLSLIFWTWRYLKRIKATTAKQ